MSKHYLPKCKCGKRIGYLNYLSEVEVSQTFSVNNGEVEYSAFDTLGNHSKEEYRCPECDMLISRTEKKAIAFFNGEEE